MKKIISLFLISIILIGSISFAEGSPSNWAENSINELKGLGNFRDEVFNDYQKEITRGEFIYIATRMYEILTYQEIEVNPDISFTDTEDIYALKGATVGITSGVGNGAFGYDQLITREQLATMMVRVLSLLELKMNEASTEKFADDSQISSWAKEAIYKARNNNIISGVGDNKVNPQGKATVEVALIIANRILHEKEGEIATRPSDGSWVHVRADAIPVKVIKPLEADASFIDKVNFYADNELRRTTPLYIRLEKDGEVLTAYNSDGKGEYVVDAYTLDYSSDIVKYYLNDKFMLMYWKANEILRTSMPDFNEIYVDFLDKFKEGREVEGQWSKAKYGTEYKIIQGRDDAFIYLKKDTISTNMDLEPYDFDEINYEYSYYGDELDRFASVKIGSWLDNSYSKAIMNPNGDYYTDLEIIDRMLQSAGIDISSAGHIQSQGIYRDGTPDEYSKDVYAKVQLDRVPSVGTTQLKIKDWAYKEEFRTSSLYAMSMNAVREILKYYSASIEDAEAIYAYIDNAVVTRTEISSPSGETVTFGNTTIKFVDPGVWGIDVVFVDWQ